ncbi:MAG: ATP-dependent helicase HrpB [Myxococcales bacterium]|nr:ATP-dependent helicase HrpB [Myxococcales bacterium]
MMPLEPLPIDPHLPRIRGILEGRRNLVLVAEPGAGKTTRVPPALLSLDALEIVVLEPRRLAARLAARRVAAEQGSEPGGLVGYQVRFEDRTSRTTRLRFVTEGILLRQLAAEPLLSKVGIVVLDEIHERHLQGDLLLALLRRLQRGPRPELRLLAMSATLEAGPIAEFLEAETLHVQGRSFPVQIEHASGKDDRPLERRVASALRTLLREGVDGDVLVFLPGAAEIRRAHEACAEICAGSGIELLALHGDLPLAEQDRAVRASKTAKVILSTNIAESSITIPNAVAVIDAGLARVARSSPWTGLSTLELRSISQASADQRAGRAGRTRPGRCVRLFTRHDYVTSPRQEAAEISRQDLSEALLLLRSLGLEPRSFPFFEAPPSAAIDAAELLLERLGAVSEGAITALGRRMLSLPVHPRLGRLLLEAEARGVLPRGALLAALLSEREIRLEARTRIAEQGRVDLRVGASDLLARLERFEAADAEGRGRAALRYHALDPAATQAVARSRDRLLRAMRAPARPAASLEQEEEALLLATIAGFPDRIGRRREPGGEQIVLAGGGTGRLAPHCVVREGALLVALEVVDRGKGPATIHAASAVEPEHLLELFEERLVSREQLRFDPRTEQVEQVRALLYDGLVLDESVRRDVQGPEVSALLAQAAREVGLARFFDLDALEALSARLLFASEQGAISLDARGLEGRIDDALLSLAQGARSFADLRAHELAGSVLAGLEPGARARLERFAPESVALPSRRSVPVHYERLRPPWIASRLQDFFGLTRGPSVAEGRVPLVLHLLAPNRRAVQVTTDLEGFWERHYPSIRRTLSRRYPRHAWPEDPLHPAKPKR